LRLQNNQNRTTKAIDSITATITAIAIIVPLESPSLLDPFPGGLERAEVVGDIVMVSVDFNADVAGSLVTTGVDQVGFVPRKNNLPCAVQFSII
jgi:hypothetical protein